MKKGIRILWAGLCIGLFVRPGSAETSPEPTVDSTVAIQASTIPIVSEGSALDKRLRYERYARINPFVLTPHRPNYILPFAYNFHPNRDTFLPNETERRMQYNEVKFQISFKANLVKQLIKDRVDIYAAYTQLSFWQAYNTFHSSPFRETDYEPELGAVLYNDVRFLGIRNRVIVLALSHQSNGQSGILSRSWNRFFGELLFQRGNLYLTLKPWYRLPESKSKDDNPDIQKYMGYGEMQLNYAMGRQVFGVMTRNSFRKQNKGAVQADWSFPISGQVKGYLQYFYGYGESLIDYNHLNKRIGIGFIITNWI